MISKDIKLAVLKLRKSMIEAMQDYGKTVKTMASLEHVMPKVPK